MGKRKELTEKEKGYKKIAVRLAVFCGFLIFIHFILISVFFTWSDWITILIFSLLFIAPAYLANASMVFLGGGKPIDGGKNWRDGRRILGDHKTWSGLIKGPLFIGIPITLGIFVLFFFLWPFIGPAYQLAIDAELYKLFNDITTYEYYFIGGPYPIGLLSLFIRIVLCAYGAGLGDLVGSFLKRRFDIESGMPFWVVDQLDFAVIAIFLVAIPSFFLPGLFWFPDVNIIIFLMILTPSVTIIGNTVGYFTGIKDVPW